MADEKDYVWVPERSRPLFINILTDISSQAITKTSIKRGYVRITPLTNDATPLNYYSLFTDRPGNNSLNSTFINTQENLNGTKNLTKHDIQNHQNKENAKQKFIYQQTNTST